MQGFKDKKYGKVVRLPSTTSPGILQRNNGDLLPFDNTLSRSSSRPGPYGRRGNFNINLNVGDPVEYRITKDRRIQILRVIGPGL